MFSAVSFLLLATLIGTASSQYPWGQSVCRLPADPGNCKAYMPMYFFNAYTCTCEIFIYGGCGGNGNRFDTFEECMTRCERTCTTMFLAVSFLLLATLIGTASSQYPWGESVCKLPAETGPCDAVIPKYFFNTSTCTCELFIYGGCGGNGNRFETYGECMNRCKRTLCYLPSDSGYCYGYFPMYFFKHIHSQMRTIIYGGCGGNGNRFKTYGECMNRCKSTCYYK
ncbi:BPTI/Kunitz domain-containing protein-like [Dreissena polymorpha]|uniref:BPTI/Kunitz domain-containing protein-like n=1 Tax=Dreissena polymorpha TaxID=45954 RepID=UPI002265285E|nr:BPTI/Kunitz domain-containing protein-like [Dreissena polymorpha]